MFIALSPGVHRYSRTFLSKNVLNLDLISKIGKKLQFSSFGHQKMVSCRRDDVVG